MGLNTLGLGIILSLRDGASIPANRAAASLGQLDSAAQTFSKNFNSAMATAFEGMNMLAAGAMMLAAPVDFVKSTLETQKALAYVASSGIEDLNLMKEAAEDFTNYWAGTTQASFLNTAYEIKSGLYELSDDMVAKMTKTTGILAKGTKSTVDEMQELLPIMWGILRPSRGGITDEAFMNELSGALAESVKIYRATGKYMGDAFSQATAIATQQGISMQEQFAILGQLQQTMTGSEAGTKLRALAVNTPRAVELAKENNIDIKLIDEKGMILPLIDIIQNVRDRYGEKLNATAMEELRKVFGSREATATIINLLPYVDKLKQDSAAIKAAMNDGMPVAMEMAETAADNMGDAWEIFAQRVNNAKQAIGEAIIPIFRPVLDIIGKIFIGVQSFAEAYPWVIRIASAIVSLVGTMLILTGALFILSAGFKIVNASIELMKSRITLLRAEFQKFMLTMWPFLLMAGLMYIAFKSNFMGIGDGVMNLIEKFKKFWNNVKLVFQGLSELIGSFSNDKGMISEDLKNKLEDAGLWDLTVKLFMLYTRLRYLWNGIVQGFSDFWHALVIVLTPIGKGLKKYVLIPFTNLLAKLGIVVPLLNKLIEPNQENANTWEKVGYWIGVAASALMTFAIASAIIKSVVGVFKTVLAVAKAFGKVAKAVQAVWKFLSKFAPVFRFIGKILLGVGKALWSVFIWVAGIVAGLLGVPVWVGAIIVAAVVAAIALVIIFRKQVVAIIKTIFYVIVGIIMAIGAILAAAVYAGALLIATVIAAVIGIIWGILNVIISIGAGIFGVLATVFAIFQGVWQAIKAVIVGIVKSVIAIVKAIFTGDFSTLGETLKGIWKGVWDKIKDIVSNTVEKIKGIWEGVGDFISGVWDGLKSEAKKFFDWIGEKFEYFGGLIDTLKKGFGWVGDKIGQAWNKVTGGEKTNIEPHATGGLFNGPSIIQIGEQAGVNEAAIPLSGKHMIPFANAIASVMPKPKLDTPTTNSNTGTVNTIINNNYNTTNNNQNGSSSNTAADPEPKIYKIEVPVKLNNREIARGVAEFVTQERNR
ncbi:MAG: Phage-related protein [Sedimentibacter sp.]|jgi:TP901 family phage tail tape measure protein|nr:Phage-related protein [Sedimentibacter sp.]